MQRRKRPSPLGHIPRVVGAVMVLILVAAVVWQSPVQARVPSVESWTQAPEAGRFATQLPVAAESESNAHIAAAPANPAGASGEVGPAQLVPEYGVSITPTDATNSAPPGVVVPFTFQLTNTGNITDTYSLSFTSTFSVTGPASVGPVGPGAIEPFSMSVSIPATATIGTTNTLTLVATSDASPTTTVTATLLTTVEPVSYGVAIDPTAASESGIPGSVVTYSLRITNTGNITDTFGISYTSDFPANGPTSAGPLLAGAGEPLTVTVSVPVTASVGATGTTGVVVGSQGAPTETVTATLTTTVVEPSYGVVITPTSSTKVGLPGSAVTYTLRVTNTGTVSDTFDLSYTSAFSFAAPTTVGPLDAGDGSELPVTVTVPTTATPGTQDVLTLQATSQGNPTATVTATLTTVVSAEAGPTSFLPVILKGDIAGTGGGAYPTGLIWNSPIVVQNLGPTTATVSVDFYSIESQTRVLTFDAGEVGPNASLPIRPVDINGLPPDQQYSAVISATEPVATIVNQTSENRLLSYNGASGGSSSVFLPNVTKNYVGFNTVIYLQNAGTTSLNDVTVVFTPFDGGPSITRTYSITPGAAVAIDPATLDDLPDNRQFAVMASSATPGAALTAVVNQIALAPGTESAYSGFISGSSTLYAPNIVRRYADYNSPVVIQNLGTTTTNLTIEYYYGERAQNGPSFAERGLQGQLARVYTTTVAGDPITLGPGESYPERAHDRPELEDGQYSMVVRSGSSDIVAIVNQVDVDDNTQAMSYNAFVSGSGQISLPNIVRNYATYQSPFVVQNIGNIPVQVTVQYFYGERAENGPTFAERGLQGMLATTETATIQPNANQPFRIHNLPELNGLDGQYSVVVTSTGGDIVAIVNQTTVEALGGSGLDAGSYEGINQ